MWLKIRTNGKPVAEVYAVHFVVPNFGSDISLSFDGKSMSKPTAFPAADHIQNTIQTLLSTAHATHGLTAQPLAKDQELPLPMAENKLAQRSQPERQTVATFRLQRHVCLFQRACSVAAQLSSQACWSHVCTSVP